MLCNHPLVSTLRVWGVIALAAVAGVVLLGLAVCVVSLL